MGKEAQNFSLRMNANSGLTHAYALLAVTVSGTSGTTSLTASGSLDTSSCVPGCVIQVGASLHEYTVATVSGTAVTTVETLSTNYSGAALRIDVISQWDGSEGFGSTSSQATAARRPVIIPEGVNGIDVIEFNAGNKNMLLATNTQTDNIFSGGGTVVVVLEAFSAGEGGVGRIMEKVTSGGTSAWNFVTTTAVGGFYRIVFNQATSGVTGSWTTGSVFELDSPQIFEIIYDSSTPTTAPRIFSQGLEVSVTETTAPTGTALNDAGGAITIGNSPGATAGMDARLCCVYMYQRSLYDYEREQMEFFLANKWASTLFDKQTKTYLARTFLISKPENPGPVPLLLCLHGGGGNGLAFANKLNLPSAFGDDEAVIVFPYATKNNRAGQETTWNDGGPETFNTAPDNEYLNDLITYITDELYPGYVDEDQIYIVGYSNGGMMAYRMAIENPSRFAGIFAISTDVMYPYSGDFSGKIEHWHGEDDINVPIAGGIGVAGVYFPPVIPAVAQFTDATIITIPGQDTINIIEGADHYFETMDPILAAAPYNTTFAQLIYDFVFP